MSERHKKATQRDIEGGCVVRKLAWQRESHKRSCHKLSHVEGVASSLEEIPEDDPRYDMCSVYRSACGRSDLGSRLKGGVLRGCHPARQSLGGADLEVSKEVRD